LLLAATALTPSLVMAETAAETATSSAGPATGGAKPSAPATNEVGDVVVTAQRRSEAVMSVPISMTVVSGTAVQAAGVVNTRDLEQLTPGLKAGQAGYVFQPALRGITSTDTNPGDESNVALYVDGVYYAAEGGSAFNLVNIKRIEVLKGPQGTLFGRNATGGAIRVITSDPEDTPHALLNASIGLDGPESREISGYVTGPLVRGKLDAGLSVYYYDDNGYMTNVDPNFAGPKQGSLNTWNVRGKLRFTPTDNLTITGEADYGHTRSGIELTTTFVDGVDGFKNVVGVLTPTQVRQVSTNEQNLEYTTAYGGYLNIEYRLPKVTFSSISAARVTNNAVSLDNDRTNLALNRNVYEVYTRTFSQEFNFATTFDGPLNFVGGVFYFWDKAGSPWSHTYAATLSPVNPVTGLRTVTSPLALIVNGAGEESGNSYSAFGEGTYKLPYHFSLVAGVRYNTDEKDAWTANLNLPSTAPLQRGHGHWSNASYRLTLNWKPSDDVLVFFTNSTGFKSGFITDSGYSAGVPLLQVKPETVDAYELGTKLRPAPDVAITASVFHYDYSNIQILTNNALSANVGVVGASILQNAASATITGADFQADVRFLNHWTGSLGVAWLPEAKYANFPNGIHYVANPGGLGATAVASDLSGTRMVRAPELTVNVGLAYTHDLFGGELRVSGNYYHSADQFLVVGEATRSPSYGLLNGEIAWTDPSTRYTVSVWARNLANTAYYISGLANTGGFSAVWGKPREIGLRLKVNL